MYFFSTQQYYNLHFSSALQRLFNGCLTEKSVKQPLNNHKTPIEQQVLPRCLTTV